MSDKELKELIASLAISQARTDEQLKKTDEGLKELKESQLKTDRQLK